MNSPTITVHIKKWLIAIAISFVALTSPKQLMAQEATLRIQKNIVERIDRLDNFIRDTIDSELMDKNQLAWDRIKALQDSLVSLNLSLDLWSQHQDSTTALLSRQNIQISQQLRMIDALNWQVKETLRLKGDIQEELGRQKGINTQLKSQNSQLSERISVYEATLSQLSGKLTEQNIMLLELTKLVNINNKLLSPAIADTSFKASPQDSSKN